jgi:hypothetical protein
MPQAKGKLKYKADALIQLVEDELPNRAQGWVEVVALYQHCSGELALCDPNVVKWHWIEKCCNKFKKPTGDPGDPKRDMSLRFMPEDSAENPCEVSIESGEEEEEEGGEAGDIYLCDDEEVSFHTSHRWFSSQCSKIWFCSLQLLRSLNQRRLKRAWSLRL